MHAGVQLSKEDVMDLRVVGSECVGKALPDLVGWNLHVKPVTSGIHADLVSQASLVALPCCMTHMLGSVPGLNKVNLCAVQASLSPDQSKYMRTLQVLILAECSLSAQHPHECDNIALTPIQAL